MIRTPCADLIDQLLAQAGEAATVDYKAPMAWPAKATDERARLVRVHEAASRCIAAVARR